MKENLKHIPILADLVKADVVPAVAVRPGEIIDVFTHPNSKCPGRCFSMEVEKVRLCEIIRRGVVVFTEVNIIGKSTTEGRVSIGGGTAIARKELEDLCKKQAIVCRRQRGNIRITTIRQ